MVLNFDNLTIIQTKLLNQISNKSVIEFNNLIEKIFKKTNKDIFWITSSVISRNTYMSSLFLDICRLDLIKYYVDNSIAVEKIIVNSFELKSTIDDYCKTNRIDIQIELKVKQAIKNKIINIIKPIKYFVANTLFTVIMLHAKNKKRTFFFNKDEPLILIDTFLYSDTLKEDSYIEKHFPGITKFINDETKEKMYFIPFFVNKRKLKRQSKTIQNYKDKFILTHDFLKLSDYLSALFNPWKKSKIDFNGFKYNGFECKYLLNADLRKNLTNTSSFQAILLYKFVSRLKDNNIKVKLFVDWFENQVIDKGINKGFSEFYPQTKKIGYEGFIISYDFNIYLRPTPYEREYGMIPEEIFAIGKRLTREVKKFDSQLKVAVAPAFRYQHVFSELKKTIKQNKIILVPLPTSKNDSYAILDMIKSTDNSNLNNVILHIKPHIDSNKSTISRWLKNFPYKYEMVDGNFKICLQKADLLICNSSTACVESVIEGVPAIIIGSTSKLLNNPIPLTIDKRLWAVCYSVDELTKMIRKMLNSKSISNKKNQESIKYDYFEPVNKETVNKFLHL